MLDEYSDAQILTFHRQWLISNGEAIEEFKRRGWSDFKIEFALCMNVALRVDETEKQPWLH